VPGALDLCFIASIPLVQVIQRLEASEWPIVEGPVMRTRGDAEDSFGVCARPDLNLIEISSWLEAVVIAPSLPLPVRT